MENRELSNKLASGEITQIKVGGAASENIVVTQADLTPVENSIALLEPIIISAEENTQAIAELEAVHDGFAYNSANGSSTTSSAWTPLNTVEILNGVAGIYQMFATVVFTYSTTTRSAYFRVSLDGGTTWLEFRKEIKDITDTHLQTQMCVIEHTTGDVNVQIEFRTESSGDTLTVLKNCMTLDRKN